MSNGNILNDDKYQAKQRKNIKLGIPRIYQDFSFVRKQKKIMATKGSKIKFKFIFLIVIFSLIIEKLIIETMSRRGIAESILLKI